jgi:hypothetical protein
MKYYCTNCGSEIKIDTKKILTYDSGNCPICGADAYGSDGLGEYMLLPAHETVKAWEKRKGRKYPDTAPVYFTHKERNAEWLAERYLFVKDRDWLHVLVATEAGAPPDGWRPEEGHK